MMPARGWVMGALLLAALPAAAAAQQAQPQAPRRPIDFSVGGMLLAPAPAGTSRATLQTASGGTLTLFAVESRFGPGVGPQATLGVSLSPAVWIEASGGWTWTTARSRISDDVESAPALTIDDRISRVTAEGAVLWYFADRGATAFFVRGGGGWMRELAGGNTLAEDGFVGGGGAGLRHWWRQNGAGRLKRLGLRVEGRVQLRWRGIAVGTGDLRPMPAASGLLVFGF